MNFEFFIPRAIGRICVTLHDLLNKPRGQQNPHNASVDDIIRFLESVGIKSGSNLLVHSSWKRLNNEKTSASALLNALQKLVSDNGTLMMPAFPANQDPTKGFSVKTSPSGAGLLSEAFRRAPGVKRSININHSVCAKGKHADYLVAEHHHSQTSWDSKSPYSRIGDLQDAWIVGLGVGHRLKIATPLHCVESWLREEVSYFEQVFPAEFEYEYVGPDNEGGTHRLKRRIGAIYPAKMARHFKPDELIETTVNGLEVYAIRANTLIERSIDLGRQGKTMYVWPIPWPWKFRTKQ